MLRRPVIPDKDTSLQAEGKYFFEVDRDANKHQIKQAVEKAFKVKVTAVNVLTVPSKERRMRGRQVLIPSWKKAIVSLKPGDKIAFFEGV